MKKFFILCAVFCVTLVGCLALQDIYSVGLGIYKDGSKAFIIDVVPNSPSALAGILPGSELLEINGQKTRNRHWE